MENRFYWTARLFADGVTMQSKYFPTMKERDEFVSKHAEWKKRGKICARNLEKHVSDERGNVS